MTPLLILALLAEPTAAAAPRTLSLDEALRLAAEQQPSIRAARAQKRALGARTEQTRAAYFPRLDGQAQYQRATANFLLSPSFAASPLAKSLMVNNKLSPADTFNYYTFGLTAQALLYDFGKTAGAVDVARAAEGAQAAEISTSEENALSAVRQAYFATLAAAELVGVAEKATANQERHVEQVRQFVAAGTRPKIDLTSAELNLENQRLSLVRARNQRDLGRVQLAQAIGLADDDFTLVAPPAMPLAEEVAPLDTLVEETLRRRPEGARLDAQLVSLRAGRRQAESAYYPALLAQGNFSGAKVEDIDFGFNWFVGLGVQWNFYAGGVTRAQLDESDAQAEALGEQRALLKQGIRADLKRERLSIAEAKERITVADRAVSTAAERLRLAEGRYQAGAGTILELDDAQIGAVNAEAQRVAALYDLQSARARLLRALGRNKP